MITKTLLALAFIAFVAGSPVLAHHSANAQFDTKQDVTLIGVVTKVENINPHSWWHLEVKGTTRGNPCTASPNGLIRQGLKVKSDIKIGDTYQFRIAPAWKDTLEDGEKLGFMKAITFGGKEYVVVEL